MNNYKILGIIIIIGLIFSICAATIYTVNNNDENNSHDAEKLNNGQLNLTENTLTNFSGVKIVNLNISQEIGGVKIKFNDSNNIYNITSDSNNPTKVTYNQSGNTLNVNVKGNDSNVNIQLSDKYIYNINSDIVLGGIDVNFSNANVNNFNSKIILGGGDFILNNGNVNKINSNINTGGINIIGNPNDKIEINSDIVIGGVNVIPNEQNLDLTSHIRLGGVYGPSYTSKTNNDYTKYIGNKTSKNIINLESKIKIGGLSLN